MSDGPTASPPEGFPGSADLRPASAERFGAFPGDAGGPATGAGAFPHARDLRGAGAERCPLGVCDGSGFVIDEQTNTASDCGCRAGRVAGARTRNLAGRIPKRYQGVSFDRPPVSDILRTAPDQIRSVRRYVQSIRENLDAGRGLWIQGDVGTGKTTLAMLVSKAALDAGRSVAIYSLPRLLNLLRESMNSEHGMLDFMDRLTAVDLLHLDDLGAENQTDWVLEQLYSIVNARYEAERAIVATTNLMPDELAARLGPRTVSRLVEICGDLIPLYGEDKRFEIRPTAHHTSGEQA